MKPGMTLLEVLTAVVILSAVVAACGSTLRDITSSARDLSAIDDAGAVYERWRMETHNGSTQSQEPWSWKDHTGSLWQVLIEEEDQHILLTKSKTTTGLPKALWRTASVRCLNAHGIFAEKLRIRTIWQKNTQ